MSLSFVNPKRFKDNGLIYVAMPNKDKSKYNTYMKSYMKTKREQRINRRCYDVLIHELKMKCVLPKHIYEMRIVLKQMLSEYFNRRIIRHYNRTELITQSYGLTKHNIVC